MLAAWTMAKAECRADDPQTSAGRNIVLVWSAAALQAVHDLQPGPPIAARAFAIVHTCIFDAWAPFDGRAVATRPASNVKRPIAERTDGNKSKAISFAAYTCLVDQFPSRQGYFAAVMGRLGYDPADRAVSETAEARLGIAAAQEVLEFRHRDGSNQLGDLHPGAYSDYTDYQPANEAAHLMDVDRWQPLAVPNNRGALVDQKFLSPHWGKVVPFALKSGDQFRPAPPASLPVSLLTGSADYREQAREIIQYTATLTDEQKVIADYWADGPNSTYPPGHWCTFADFVSQRDRHSLDDDVKMFFALANALLDASIAAWDAKRAYESVRPVTAIRYLYSDQKIRGWAGPGQSNVEMLGKDWQPFQDPGAPTPPFPEFVSGHSSFSAAAAEILKAYTGSDIFGMQVTIPAGSSRIEPGVTPKNAVTLSWATFTDAADQAGISRRFGGIHFKSGDLAGREMGRKVSREVWKKASYYFGVEDTSSGQGDGVSALR
ncbi:MAG TPA: vanadium-dependent haloperoxidase [Stellaceae bacterium]|nr:vanadium-dependent haloperoxidase [Stellaceae bacterium]